MILYKLERSPGLTQNELAAIVEVEPITVARLIDRLEAKGLVERRHDPTDRRVWRLHLRPEAGPMIEEIETARQDMLELLLGEAVSPEKGGGGGSRAAPDEIQPDCRRTLCPQPAAKAS